LDASIVISKIGDALIVVNTSVHFSELGYLVVNALVMADDSVFISTEVVSSVTVVVTAVNESESMASETAAFVVVEATFVIMEGVNVI